MASSQFSLSWESHRNNICTGLSSLQQNGEFVDMTLAADGHMVKVHQVIIALASPYIKELISSAQCQHPVIFLNKISYTTLSSILEYVYTGEVVVSIDNLDNFVEAGKELHIKGLEDMNIHGSVTTQQQVQELSRQMEEETLDEEYCYFEVADGNGDKGETTQIYSNDNYQISKSEETDKMEEGTFVENFNERTIVRADDDEQNLTILPDEGHTEDKPTARLVKQPKLTVRNFDVNSANVGLMQYTVSNQGSLQMILNRFIYYLKHTNRDGSRQWRCVDYLNAHKCPAHVNTNDDVVQQRIACHNHTFHDKRILKKLKAQAIFSAIKDAEAEGALHKNTRALEILQKSE